MRAYRTPEQTAADRSPRVVRIVERDDIPVEQAEARLLVGVRNALLMELVLIAGVLAAMLAVAYWPHP